MFPWNIHQDLSYTEMTLNDFGIIRYNLWLEWIKVENISETRAGESLNVEEWNFVHFVKSYKWSLDSKKAVRTTGTEVRVSHMVQITEDPEVIESRSHPPCVVWWIQANSK